MLSRSKQEIKIDDFVLPVRKVCSVTITGKHFGLQLAVLFKNFNSQLQ